MLQSEKTHTKIYLDGVYIFISKREKTTQPQQSKKKPKAITNEVLLIQGNSELLHSAELGKHQLQL